jgi:hypothetical protein
MQDMMGEMTGWAIGATSLLVLVLLAAALVEYLVLR